jgi:hypothetical protein
VRLAALALVLLALPLEAWALESGARVRVTLLAREAPQVTGIVLAIPTDSLVVAAEPDSLARSIARLDIKKLEVSRGVHSNAGKGATIGALVIGVAVGLTVLNAASIDGTSKDSVAAGIAGGAVGAIVGAGLGALIGSGSHREFWDDVRVKK